MFITMNLALLYFGGYRGGDTPTLNKTITIAENTPGISGERNPGFVDTEGNGYVEVLPLMYNVIPGARYKVKYFCGIDDNVRRVISIEYISPEPTPTPTKSPIPDSFKCRTVNGVCK